MKTIGQLLRKARRDRDLTIYEVALRIDTSTTNLYCIERNKRDSINPELLYKLAVYYNLSSDVVFITAGMIPKDITDKILRSPQLLEVIRQLEE